MAQASHETRRSQPSYNQLPPLATMTEGVAVNGQTPKSSQASYEPVRDSGNWSMPSKHSSTVSSNPGIHHLLNPDDSPRSRISEHSPAVSYSSSNGPQGLTHLNQSYPPRRESTDTGAGTFLDSRRSSVESSRMSMNLNQLALNHPTSPYDSTNASQTSLTSSLQQQRGIPRLNGASNQFSPMHSRPVPRAGLPPRQAPQIAPPGSRSGGVSNPTANTPTKGEPWAFPEDPEVDDDDMGLSSPTSSRHASLASSSLHDHGNYSHASLQPRSVTSLQSGDSIATTGNYSRTPELRVSHKLAERKRRSEMKDLFDQLNTILPNSPGNKSSKWEVLTKAIDYIQHIQGSSTAKAKEADQLREELHRTNKAMEDSRADDAEFNAMYQQLCRLDPQAPHTYGPRTHALEQRRSGTNRLAPMQQHGQQQQQHVPQAVNGQSSWNPSQAMQGIEYASSYDRR